ncbi:hypothetical protein BHM03_00021118 [Ensete ventricosum]|nr:hypothetical protein BHM03_00021118 [Ensete ventricosum]
MWLETRLECVESSPRVSRACQDSAREFTERIPRLVGRLSWVAERLAGNDGPRSSLGIGPGSDDAVRPRREFARRFAEGIGKLAGNTSGDCRKKIGKLA